MLTLRSSSRFDLFDRLEQELNQQLQSAERVPAAEVRDSAEGYEVVLELPGVDKDAIEVKATDRTLMISAERKQRSLQAPGQAPADSAGPEGSDRREAGTLLSEFRYGLWSRRFRFPVPIEREQLQASYRDGLLTVKAPKANQVSSVKVAVAG
ncbi:MAG: Hsp20/alpha crystallin family protein [Synechococcus sp. ELA057]